MTILNNVLSEIKSNKKLREEGKYIGLPVPFPRMRTKFPYITKGRYGIVTAGSKIGKTQIADFLFLYWPFIFSRELNTNLKFKVKYFSLEMSKEDKVKACISFLLFYYKGVVASPDKFSSQYDDYILEDSLLKEIEDLQPIIDEFLENVEIIDNIRNGYGIYKHCEEYAESHGTYTYKTIDWKNDDGKIVPKEVVDSYIPDDPDEIVIVITDHLSLIVPENNKSLHESMGEFSSRHCLKMRDRFKMLVVNVQQQAQAQEGVENKKAGMLKPSHNGLADNKLTGRDVDFMFGLFSPARFNIKEHEGYDITKLRDNYREFITVLNRRGPSISTDLYFNGEMNYFKELLKPEFMNELNYNKIKNISFNRKLI